MALCRRQFDSARLHTLIHSNFMLFKTRILSEALQALSLFLDYRIGKCYFYVFQLIGMKRLENKSRSIKTRFFLEFIIKYEH